MGTATWNIKLPVERRREREREREDEDKKTKAKEIKKKWQKYITLGLKNSR